MNSLSYFLMPNVMHLFSLMAKDRISHVQGHVTVTYRVRRECQSVDLCLNNFVDRKENKNRKNHRFICTRTRNRMSYDQGHITVTYKVTREGHGVDIFR